MKNADTSIIKIKKFKQRLYKRRYMKGKQTHEKVLDITSCMKNTN